MSETVLTAKPAVATLSRVDALKAALVAGLLGSVLVYGVGFAQPNLLHNVAHDGRHSLAFPCH